MAPAQGDLLELVREIPAWPRREHAVQHVWARLATLPATHDQHTPRPRPPARVARPPASPSAALLAIRAPR